ncbi:MAG: phosphotransferase family protein, partial [Pseudonocardiaceae bacterium]
MISQKPGGFLVASATGGQGKVAVKMDTRAASVRREHAAYEFLASHRLPVAPVLAYGEVPAPVGATDTNGAPVVSVTYLVTRWLEGRPVSTADPPTTHCEVGRLLRMIHDIPTAGWANTGCPPGYDTPGESEPVEEWIRAWLLVALRWWETTGEPAAGELTAAQRWFDRLLPELAAVSRAPFL